jgi:hypothetical protein
MCIKIKKKKKKNKKKMVPWLSHVLEAFRIMNVSKTTFTLFNESLLFLETFNNYG